MKIVFVSNYMNEHQISFCNYMYETDGIDFVFLETENISNERKQLGWKSDYHGVKYLVNTTMQDKYFYNNHFEDADVIIIGDTKVRVTSYKLKNNVLLLYYRERLFKKDIWLKHIRYVRLYFKYHVLNRKYKKALLCASAYAAGDFNIISCFENRCYKWGYFPKFIEYDIKTLLNKKQSEKIVNLIWVGRLISWKRCGDLLKVVNSIKDISVPFKLTIVGTGVLENELKNYVKNNELSEKVFFAGSCQQDNVRVMMEKSHICVMTSNKEEGWGAVVNEAMNAACIVIGSNEAGSVPFLIKNNYNGYIYNSNKLDSLYQRLKFCIENYESLYFMAVNAYNTIKKSWNAKNASINLVSLIQSLLEGEDTTLLDGPCSKAEIINDFYREKCDEN